MEKQDTQPNSEPRDFDADKVLTEMYGANYHGPSSSDSETQTVDESAADETQIDSDAVSQETEVQEDVGETQTDEDQGEPASTKWSDFLETNELDTQWADSLQFDVTVNGETSQVPLGELRSSYQLGQAAEAELSHQKEKTGEIVAELTKRAENIEATAAQVEQLAAYGEQMVLRDFQGIDWNDLKENDPGLWAEKYLELQTRKNEIDNLRATAGQHLESLKQQNSAQADSQLQEVLKAEQAQLLELVPEWKDASVQEKEKSELSDYLVNKMGFPQDDVANVTSAKLVVMARKAKLWDDSQQQMSAAKKKVATAPRVLKPGAPKSSQKQAQDKIAGLRKRAEKSGSIEDVAALLAAERGAT